MSAQRLVNTTHEAEGTANRVLIIEADLHASNAASARIVAVERVALFVDLDDVDGNDVTALAEPLEHE